MPTYYNLRLFKSWVSRSNDGQWSNNYEFSADAALESVEMQQIVDGFTLLEKGLHGSPVQFMRAVVSTWLPDSHPYDPTKLRVFSLQGTGAQVGNAVDYVDLNFALSCNRNVTLGKAGRVMYRGVLRDSHCAKDSRGKLQLTDAANGLLSGALEDAMENLVTVGNMFHGLINLVEGTGATDNVYFRVINSYSIGSVVYNKMNHKFFNHAPAAPGP